MMWDAVWKDDERRRHLLLKYEMPHNMQFSYTEEATDSENTLSQKHSIIKLNEIYTKWNFVRMFSLSKLRIVWQRIKIEKKIKSNRKADI